jgi:hypothetical protein
MTASQPGVEGRSMMHARLSKHVVGVVDLGAWNERPGSGPQAELISMELQDKLDVKQQDVSLNTIRAIMVGRCGPSVARPHKLCEIVTNAAHRPQH